MAEISAADVAALRKATGAGMMDCKKALNETDGDPEAAAEWLRKKGLSGSKRDERNATDGAIDVMVEGGVGALVELTAETDFVAKGADFTGTVAALTRLALDEGKEELVELEINGEPVGEHVTQLAARLGENVALGRVVVFESADGVLDGYKHVQNERGTIGVIVELGGVDASSAQTRAVAHDIALHIANKSTAPRYVSRDDFPADVVETERAFHEKQTAEEGKPEAARPKIVEGKMTGFFKGQGGALLDQGFVKDNKQTIAALLGTLGKDATVRRFARVEIGAD